jgi:hypothetical protein
VVVPVVVLSTPVVVLSTPVVVLSTLDGALVII